MDNLDKKLEQLIKQLQELKKSQIEHTYNFQVVEEEICKSLPNGQWILQKNKKLQQPQQLQQPSLVYPKDTKARIKEKAIDEFKNRMRDVINFHHKNRKPIPSRLILLDEGMPYKHPSLTNKERLEIFQNTAKDLGLHPDYPIHHDHNPKIDEQEFNMPKGQRVTVSIPKHTNIKLNLPFSESQQKPTSDLHRQGFGGYLIPKYRKIP